MVTENDKETNEGGHGGLTRSDPSYPPRVFQGGYLPFVFSRLYLESLWMVCLWDRSWINSFEAWVW